MAKQKAYPDIVRRLAEHGHSQSTIGVMLGVSRERIRQICQRDGIETMPGQIDYDIEDKVLSSLSGHNSYTQLANELGMRPNAVRRILRRNGFSIDVPRSKYYGRIMECIEMGMTMSETARALGVKIQTIHGFCKRHNLEFRAKHRKPWSKDAILMGPANDP